ncbi:MAG: hypothetical protein U1D30_15580 [Planctomycetota bacterium]
MQKPQLLIHVARPFLVFVPREPKELPPAGLDGEFKVSMRLLGVIPLGWQMIRVTRTIDADGTCHLRDDGYSPLIRRWDHRIRVQPISKTTCEYSDTIDIEAGLLTPLVFVFAHLFFRWRQHRWRQLVLDPHFDR